MTGYHADFGLLEACGVTVDPASGVPTHDPSTLESNVPNLFLAGGVLAGKDTAPIFIENGRFHGERIVKVLAERRSGLTATSALSASRSTARLAVRRTVSGCSYEKADPDPILRARRLTKIRSLSHGRAADQTRRIEL